MTLKKLLFGAGLLVALAGCEAKETYDDAQELLELEDPTKKILNGRTAVDQARRIANNPGAFARGELDEKSKAAPTPIVKNLEWHFLNEEEVKMIMPPPYDEVLNPGISSSTEIEMDRRRGISGLVGRGGQLYPTFTPEEGQDEFIVMSIFQFEDAGGIWGAFGGEVPNEATLFVTENASILFQSDSGHSSKRGTEDKLQREKKRVEMLLQYQKRIGGDVHIEGWGNDPFGSRTREYFEEHTESGKRFQSNLKFQLQFYDMDNQEREDYFKMRFGRILKANSLVVGKSYSNYTAIDEERLEKAVDTFYQEIQSRFYFAQEHLEHKIEGMFQSTIRGIF
jgi:hypothetical protein